MLKKVIGIIPLLVFAGGVIFIQNPIVVASEQENHIFATWEGFEADKCASIWLIVRFIDQDAELKFYPKGTPITSGIAFDTPDARLRRYHNLAAYESMLRHYGLDDPALIHIGKIIHDIEVNTWQRKRYEETVIIQEDIRKIIEQNPDRKILIKKILTYFDNLYERFKKKVKP
jgi:hypothetical protein